MFDGRFKSCFGSVTLSRTFTCMKDVQKQNLVSFLDMKICVSITSFLLLNYLKNTHSSPGALSKTLDLGWPSWSQGIALSCLSTSHAVAAATAKARRLRKILFKASCWSPFSPFCSYCTQVNPGFAGGAYGYVSMGPYKGMSLGSYHKSITAITAFPGGQSQYLRVPFADLWVNDFLPLLFLHHFSFISSNAVRLQ